MKASKSLNDVVIHVIDDAFASQELICEGIKNIIFSTKMRVFWL